MALADAPWPKIKCDPGNTSRSPYTYDYNGTVTKSVSIDAEGMGYSSSLVIGSDTVFVGKYAFSLDGKPKWTAPGEGYSGWPVLSDGVIFYGRDRGYTEGKGYLDFISLETGEVYKSIPFDATSIGSLFPKPGALTIVKPSDIILMPCQRGLVAFDAWGTPPTILWTREYTDPSGQHYVDAVCAADYDVAYIGLTYAYPYTQHTFMWALTMPNGNKKWNLNYKYDHIESFPMLVDGRLYFFIRESGVGTSLVVLDADTGGTVKTIPIDFYHGLVDDPFMAASSDGLIYFGCSDMIGIYNIARDTVNYWYINGGRIDSIILDANNIVYIGYSSHEDEKVHGLRAYRYSYDEEKKEERFERIWENKNISPSEMAIGGNGALYVLQANGYPDYDYTLHILSAAKAFICDTPSLLTTSVGCAKPEIVLQSPIPSEEDEHRLHFKVQAYADEAGTLKLDEVDSTLNPERFKYSPDNGTTWRDFLADGLPPEQYGALIKVRVDVGPRQKVWLRASVGA